MKNYIYKFEIGKNSSTVSTVSTVKSKAWGDATEIDRNEGGREGEKRRATVSSTGRSIGLVRFNRSFYEAYEIRRS